MKTLYFIAILVITSTFCCAQARLTTTEYQKVMQPGVEIDVPFPEKTVMKSIVDMLEKKGYKGKDTKGYYTFKGVILPELGAGSHDLYFKTERKSRREKDNTILTMLISNGYDKFIGDSTDSMVISNSKLFLNKQTESVAAYDLEMQIMDQESSSKSAAKKLASLVEDGQNLQKKKERIERDIQENLKKQEEQKVEAEKQGQIFNTLKNKRKQ